MLREPVAAGMFYPSGRGELEGLLKGLFQGAGRGRNLGVVSPHAGYLYSGRGSALAIASLRKADRFIVLGPNHTGLGPEFSIMGEGEWGTPLGSIKLDSGLAGRLKKACPFLEEDSQAHSQEHSIEVQLPFLQHRFGRAGFVPICIINSGYSRGFLGQCRELGRGIAKLVREGGTGIVASSDFSHYIPLEQAEKAEKGIIGKILKLDLEGFFRALEQEQASICGFGPIAVLMSAARELGLKGRLIHSSNSGEASGDFSSVVSYRALGFG